LEGGVSVGEEKAPNWWLRVLNVVFGLVCILLSAVVLAYPGLDTLTLILILAIALLVVGLARVMVGVFAEFIPIRLRAIIIGASLFEIAVTMINILYPQYITQTLIQLLSVALLVHATISAVIGGYVRAFPSLLRGLFVLAGLLGITMSVAAFLSTPLGFLASVYLLAIGYLSHGIVEVNWGITGPKRTKSGALQKKTKPLERMGKDTRSATQETYS
jgi:uncharacterized membrane protein HdeD (DUF308 family)